MFHVDKGTPISYYSQAFALRKACERILFGGVREVVYLCNTIENSERTSATLAEKSQVNLHFARLHELCTKKV